jgi:heme exporter protein CcmD
MTHVGYVVAGYSVTAAALGGYAWWIVSRSRALRRDHERTERASR